MSREVKRGVGCLVLGSIVSMVVIAAASLVIMKRGWMEFLTVLGAGVVTVIAVVFLAVMIEWAFGSDDSRA